MTRANYKLVFKWLININHLSLPLSQMSISAVDRKEQASVGSVLGRRYGQLLHGAKYTDCVFHVCEEQVKCHKLILSSASPVFEAMFFGPMQNNEPEPEIEIHDISSAIFKVLVEYIYTGVVDYNGLASRTGKVGLYKCLFQLPARPANSRSGPSRSQLPGCGERQ